MPAPAAAPNDRWVTPSIIWTAGRLMLLTLHPLTATEPPDDALPLPRWTEEEGISPAPDSGDMQLGGSLLPRDLSFIQEMEGVESLPPLQSPSATPSDNFLFFIPKGGKIVKGPPPPLLAAPPIKYVEVAPDFLAKCESQPTDDHLFDPGMVLPETQGETLRRLLSYHAEEAATSANLLLLDENQKLPPKMDLARIGAGRLLEGHQCLVVYPMGQPLRSRLFMSHKITAAVPPVYLQGLLRACVTDALQATEPEEQLQRFATQLSIRLIWMERAYPVVFQQPAQTGPPPVMQASEALLPEVAPVAPATERTKMAQWLALWHQHWPKIAWGAGILVIALILAMMGLRTLRRRQRQTVWMLPESHHETRLGGPHCGGGGAWIKFG